MAPPSEVVHEEAAHRFVTTLNGHEAYLLYRLTGNQIDFYYTYVPEAVRGRRVAEQLAAKAFEHAKAHRLAVVPSCPYISATFLKRHPEYQPLVKE